MSLVARETLERVSASGRWTGAITSRPLADSDAEVAEIDPRLRGAMARVWLTQAAAEARVATSFARVHESLVSLGADRGLIALAARAVDDEHRHAALCEELAGRHAGAPCGPPPTLAPRSPAHEAARSDAERRALWVVGQCAFNETFATAYLSAARDGAESPLARAGLRELLIDEIDHARIGWAFLTSASAPAKRALSDWLLPLAICNLREWRHLGLPDDERLVRHGVPRRATVERALLDALAGVVVPGLAHAGLETTPLERWLARGAPVEGSPAELAAGRGG